MKKEMPELSDVFQYRQSRQSCVAKDMPPGYPIDPALQYCEVWKSRSCPQAAEGHLRTVSDIVDCHRLSNIVDTSRFNR